MMGGRDGNAMKRHGLQSVLLGAGLLLLAGGLIISRSVSAPVDELSSLALGLAIIITAASFGGDLAGRFGQPAVLGELLAGILLGNLPGLQRLQPIGADPYLDVLSRIGMLLLLFEVGLGLSVRDLFAVGPSSLLVAVFGTVSSFALGSGAAALLLPSAPHTVHAFLGAATTATSVGITARVLKDIGASQSAEAQIILGAAVIDDVLALVVLGVAVGWLGTQQGGAVSAVRSIAALVAKTLGFLTLALVLGMRLTPTWFRQAARMRTDGALLAVGLCFCFFLSWAASAIGLAALVGAFAAGLVLEDAHSEIFVQRGERSLNQLLQPMTSFLVPVFFVLVGLRTNLRALADPVSLGLPLALTGAAVIGKLSCAIGVVNRGVKRSTVAIGMVPRGEVALVFAALGGQLRLGHAPLVDERGYTAILAVVILTTLVTPPALKWSLRPKP
jgi:Kef-type K+ transport system membrane component KefB